MMQTPFFDEIQKLAGLKTRFFVPGHKGNPLAIPAFGEWLRYDLTEIEGAGDLSCPSGALEQSEQNMAKAYASGATLYSASGSTSCILAMLTLFCRPDEPVVIARGCHASAVRAFGFTGAVPVWVPLRGGRPHPEDIQAALVRSGAKNVYVTSPDYEGRMADIPALAAVCRKAGARLLVDNAHGAHLRFLKKDLHPLALGADACADSAHKTLPCLTPAALLHLRDKSLKGAARDALNLYSSTSPSYPVLCSLDLAAGFLLGRPAGFDTAAENLAAAVQKAGHLGGVLDDPLKVCLKPAQGGWQARQVEDALKQAGIYPELTDSTRIVLMGSPANTQKDYEKLKGVLAQFERRAPVKSEAEVAPLPLPEVACSVREALFSAKERIPVQAAAGRINAGIAAPCPPGVPLVMPGEKLAAPYLEQIAAGGILEIDVVK